MKSIPEENQIDCNYTSSTAQWRESCNWCRCTETRRALCTRRGCPPAGPKVERASLAIEKNEQLLGKSFERSGNETECQMITDDGSWRNKCNWCRCEGGKRLCTRKLCHPDLEEKSEGTSDCNGKVKWKNGCEICECVNGHSVCSPEFCKPDQEPLCKVKRKGSRFREGCNWCACRDGRPICTEIGCSPDNPRIVGTPICEGEISWKKDCNWCRCVNGEAKCTEKFCRKDNNCKEGISWVEGCNTCICTSGSPFCTRRACSDHVANEIQPLVLKHRAEELTTIASTFQSQSKICTEGSQWMSDCNLCTCRNGLPLCTLIACSPGNDTVIHPPCTEDSQWKEDCNVCKCTNGIPVCTRKDCDDEKLNQQPKSNGLPKSSVPFFNLNPSEDCTDGSRWKRDCNWCNCMNGKGACTLMGCLRGFKNNGPQCENGSVWRGRNCSICHCENEKAVCEDSSCHTKTSETGATPEEGEPVNKILPNEDCTEGSRWRVDCNWCFCSRADDPEKPQCTNDSQWMKDNSTWCFCDKEKAKCSPSKCVSETSTITAGTPSTVSPSTKMGKEISSESRNQTPLCSEGSRWVNRCNWCTCANGVGLCEQKACTSDNYREMDKTCDGKSRWKDGCNWCKCVNGKGNCTTKDCTKKTEVNDPPNEKCKVGSSWLEDCNICVCTNKTTVCTKKECKPTARGSNDLCSEDKE
ncbi:hypothetical protein Anas_06869 [Armadillidium nasatum]|uniref:Pacifastin domain-containing protein n=1 Tax=Armadillidium nasatum TaxID=96803 RepID=A0A5N5T2U8_9CRUS|nr:hypothetical protein Anas_06869 [Armadillidium nasatum]